MSHPARWLFLTAALLSHQGLSGFADPHPSLPSSPARLDVALYWPTPSERAAWPGRFSVSNLGRLPTGPVDLEIRTPLGLASHTRLLEDLSPGGTATRRLAIALEPGMTEVCLEVRVAPGRAARHELDLRDNRICRRPHRLPEGADTRSIPQPEVQP